MRNASIREMTEADRAAAVEIANGLPEWFDPTARERSIPTDVRYQTGFVAVEGGRVVGFMTVYVAEGCLNIGWLGVRRDSQGRGIGTALLGQAEDYAGRLGIDQIATYTLGDGVDYPPYDQTRRFYFKNGFQVYRRSRTDNPGCPEEIRIRKRLGQG